MPNHYETLGVSKEADENEIKKAYRQLSLKYHPDRNGGDPEATEKYKIINEAYETLGDSQKREQYNMELQFGGRPGGMPGGFPGGGGDINEIFNMMFGGGFPGGGFPGGMGGFPGGPGIRVFHSSGGGFPGGGIESLFQQIHRPPIITKTVSITLEQAYHGTTVQVEIEKQNVRGNLQFQETEILQIQIPPGVDDNEGIMLKGQGHSINESIQGDVKIQLKIENNTIFTRHGSDLFYNKHISLKESLCGFAFELKHLNGKTLNMNNTANPSVVKPNFKKVVPGLGMVKNGQTGNLVIELFVDFPDSLTQEQLETLKNIL
jgi:molecular chaperone DnaJ